MNVKMRHPVRLAVAIAVLMASFTLGQIRSSSAPSSNIHFTNVDVLIDPHGIPLAAYQIEFLADPARVKLVGIEGGQHSAFKQPPYYDPKALAGPGNRVIIAALNTGNDLPHDRTRIARLHLRVVGDELPKMSARLVTAASSNEKTIRADVSVTEGAAQ
jgi:hypothetical protein